MKLGAFSISLAVADLQVSQEFYEKLGFTVVAGGKEQNYLIMDNAGHKIGLFQGMFDKNILTFNPGWDQNGQPVEDFTDVRELEKQVEGSGIEITTRIDATSDSGPASFVIVDPDGNPVLFDQHR